MLYDDAQKTFCKCCPMTRQILFLLMFVVLGLVLVNPVSGNAEAARIAEVPEPDFSPAIEGWLPYGRVFDLLAHGRRHVMMGASQIDRFGNQNISCIGDWARPRSQLLGVRGAPGNTVNHATSYWVREHTPRVFVPQVDMVCGVGNDRAAAGPASARRFHDLRLVVTNLATLDFDTPDGSMRLRSVHPGVGAGEVIAQTGFALTVPEPVPLTRTPDEPELRLIREVLDPDGRREAEVGRS